MKTNVAITAILASAAIHAAEFEPLNIDLERVEVGTNAVWTFTWPARTLTSIRIQEVGTNVNVTVRSNPRIDRTEPPLPTRPSAFQSLPRRAPNPLPTTSSALRTYSSENPTVEEFKLHQRIINGQAEPYPNRDTDTTRAISSRAVYEAEFEKAQEANKP